MLKGIGAQGVNVGMNLGKSGGATGIAEHIHYVIPRLTAIPISSRLSQIWGLWNDFEKIYTHLKGLVAGIFHAK